MTGKGSEPQGKRASAHTVLWLLLLLVAAAGVRLPHMGLPFDMDEIWVVQSLETHDRNITPPLYYGLLEVAAGAPVQREWALRLPALASGLLAVILPLLMVPCVRTWLDGPCALLWAAMMACSSPLVFYSAFVKQYASEVVVAVLLLLLFLRVCWAPERTAPWLLFGAFGAVACVSLYSPVFLYAGTFAASLVLATADGWSPGRWNRTILRNSLLVHGLLGAVSVAAYLLWLRSALPAGSLNARSALDAYWSPFFWDGSPGFVVRQTRQAVGHFLNLTPWGLPFVGGLTLIWLLTAGRDRIRHRVAVLLMVTTPFVALLCASGMRLYPYGSIRLMLFLAPSAFYLVSVVLTDLLRGRRRLLLRWVGACMLALFIAKGAAEEPYATHFMGYGNRAPVFDLLRQNYRVRPDAP